MLTVVDFTELIERNHFFMRQADSESFFKASHHFHMKQTVAEILFELHKIRCGVDITIFTRHPLQTIDHAPQHFVV